MIALGCDHAGFELKQAIIKHLDERKIEYKDYGTYSEDSVDYAVYAEKTARAVANGECELGLLFCGTGVGISMAANKVRGIRAACCSDLFSAEMTRRHNDANILCLGGRVVSPEKATELVDIFLDTPFSGEERHARRIAQIADIENRN
ncbi:MAG: ribose 5-phosphate isomerase B [Oscillospiraceae bacterium]|nr:ribose 5-phosphate isomerase B [Clostridiaceae bacterium]MDO4495674.1 ribose 5-phosphate isomerase B [Clostridiaceae bacterium]MDY5949268.1 ribose 5-phosphate isomerase B [Oscillospiraceae bacterium]